MVKYRSRTDIVAMILQAAIGGTTKTKLMYKAFLSYAQLKEYIALLIENDLLEYHEGDQKYVTTSKGNKFLNIYGEISHLISNIEE